MQVLKASCHCGKVTITMKHCVEQITRCNCSICHRLGTLWGYYKTADVIIEAENNNLASYCHGDEYIHFHHCKHCGCATHYTLTEKAEADKIAVNYRMVDPSILPQLETRIFDGADSWKTLRIDPATADH